MESKSLPLLECHDLKLSGDSPLEVGSLTVEASRLALWDDAERLLRAILEPTAIARGTISIGGQPPDALLMSGRAAYVPRRLPLDENVRLDEAIALSAKLVGLPKADGKRSLERCRIAAHGKRRLGELSRLQMRLACIAHGLLSDPQVLLLENVYENLDDAESAIVEALLEVELEKRQLIAATSSRDPASRALARQCDQALVVAGNLVLPPAAPSEFETEGHWVRVDGNAAALSQRLSEKGAVVTRSPRDSVLLVRQITGSAIYREAMDAGLSVVELTPAGIQRDLP